MKKISNENRTEKDYRLLNGLALAYMGDAIYEVYIRQHLLSAGYTKPHMLHRAAKSFVSAKAQAALVKELLAEELLTPEETEMYKRGRNAKSHTSAKNTDITTYRISTGFEALFGYLYLTQQLERMETLIDWCIEKVEATEE